jgi:hypothetical protein
MSRWLRQSTSVDVPIGPFVDATDGVTAETALTITQPDVRLKKNGGAWAQKAAAQTLSHEENGNYEVTLDATDTNTLGLLRLHVAESGALPVWDDFLVVPANVWDSLFASDRLQVDVLEISSDTTAADNLELAYDDTAGAVPWNQIIDQGTAQSATSTTLVLRAAAAFADDLIIGATIIITGGSAGVGQARVITDYVSSTDTATVAQWTVTPTGTITYKIVSTPPNNFDAAALTILKLEAAFASSGVFSTAALANAPAATQFDIFAGSPTPLTASAGSASSVTSADLAAYATSSLKGMVIEPLAGTATGQRRKITANTSNGASSTADFEPFPTGAMANTNTFKILKDANPLTGDAYPLVLATAIRSALGLASANIDTQLGALPTNAELATALGTADDAVLAAIAALNNLSSAQLASAIAAGDDAVLAAIVTVQAALTDLQSRTVAALNNGCVPADVQRINDQDIGATKPYNTAT